MNNKTQKTNSIPKQLAELETLPTEELRSRWKILNGQDPPRFNRQFLIKRLAYRIQEIAYGGLDEHTKTRMDQLLDDEGYDKFGKKVRASVKRAKENAIVPGTMLVREWQGERHEGMTAALNIAVCRIAHCRRWHVLSPAHAGTALPFLD